MKQLLQNMKNGELMLAEVPSPIAGRQTVLVHNHYSLISAGTEKTKIELGQKSLWQKARARPDHVKKVIQKIKTEGLWQTYQKVNERLETPSPLGYSCAGVIVEAGSRVKGLQPGDRVACAGAGYANHAEMVSVPQNLCVKIPPSVSSEHAAFTTVGAIALQGLRNAEPQIGETFLVIGLGLIGQITVQLLLANGCRVLATDLDPQKLEMAGQQGAITLNSAQAQSHSLQLTDQHGVDGTLICASTDSDQPVTLAGEATRERGRVVAVGAVGLNIPREPYYQKEIQLSVARSYGPGRYDPRYEEHGIDYPYGYVRFTENRNMAAFLQLLEQNKLDIDALISHRYPFDEALTAYEKLSDNSGERCLGMVLTYSQSLSAEKTAQSQFKAPPHSGRIRIGMAGGGQYASGTLIPAFKQLASDIELNRIMTARGHSAYHIANKHGFHQATASFEELLADDIDLLTIATQHHEHARLTCQGLQAGKHVYTEKPLALTMPELRSVYKAWQEHADRILWVGFNRRFAPLTRELKHFMASRADGMMIDIQVNAGTIDPGHWIQDPDVGGGRVIGEACHFVDLAGCLTNSEPVAVFSRGLAYGHQSALVNDNVLLNLAFADGSIANITYTAGGSSRLPKERVTVHCEGKSAVLEDFKNLWLYSGSRKARRQRLRHQDKGQRAMLSALTSSIQSGESQLPARAVFLNSLATLKAVESLASGYNVPVSWQELEADVEPSPAG